MVVVAGCPNHGWQMINPNYPALSEISFTIPAQPELRSSGSTDLMQLGLSAACHPTHHSSLSGGEIGILFDGATVFSAYGGPSYGRATGYANSAPAAEGDTFDQCGQHAASTMTASYHSHIPPPCLLRQLNNTDSEHSPQIGWAADGFPIYGPRGPQGIMMKTCTVQAATDTDSAPCLDDCAGRQSTNPQDGYEYRYYIIGEYTSGDTCSAPTVEGESKAEYFPFTPACLRGCCPNGVECSTAAVELPTCNGASTGATSDVRPAQAALPVDVDSCFVEFTSMSNGSKYAIGLGVSGSLIVVCAFLFFLKKYLEKKKSTDPEIFVPL